jgi:hypothetical protein
VSGVFDFHGEKNRKTLGFYFPVNQSHQISGKEFIMLISDFYITFVPNFNI